MTNLEKIVTQFKGDWVRLTDPKFYNDLVPKRDDIYEIFTTEGEFVVAQWNSRKEIWLSEDGGDGYDALAWRMIPMSKRI